jgi:hypothetical protein
MSVLSALSATAAVTLLAVGSVAGASVASANSTGSGDGTLGPRLATACGRVGHRIERVEKVATRFHADAGTRGSIAYLQARIDAATKAGQTDLVRVLNDRMAVRKDIDATLPDILTHLKDAQSVCAAHGADASSAPATS